MLKVIAIIGMSLLICTGCASYATPGRGADLSAVGAPSAASLGAGTDSSIRQAFDKQPLAHFPTSIAVARIQAPAYQSQTATGWGVGKYCLVTMRDVEKPEQIQRLNKLPLVNGICPINRMLIDGELDSDLPLRRAAAKVQADLLLVYTLDTTFTTENKLIPLSMISLGLSPNKQVRVTTTASAVLLDTRNGYIYGVAEATSQENRLTNSWQNDVAIDETRRSTESNAFGKLVGEFETTWTGVIANRAAAVSSTAPSAIPAAAMSSR